ncbi:MAG: hypothetical protein KIT73_07665, partial [Burkholderiales bacterium]|nr:hypothetical protein [Burkholderiales bacterium]
MHVKTLAAACAFACAGFASQASAQAIGPFDTPNLTIYLAGASAPDNFLESIATGIFDAGFIRYQDDGGTPSVFTDDGRSYRAFFGRVKNDATIPAALRGQTVLFVKRSKGGSVWGVNPVARAERIGTLNLTAGTCVLNSSIYRCVEKGIDPGLAGYLNPSNAGVVPDIGVSDVEPALFKAPYNVEFGQSALTATEVARLDVKPANVLMMGIVATNAVPATTHIGRTAYGSMLSGSYQDWSQIDPSIASGNTQVVVCRRVQGSGTQTSYNWFFNNFPCQGAFSGVVAPRRMVDDSASGITGGNGTQGNPFTIDPTAGYTVVENSSSGNVRDCLTRAQTNQPHTFRGDDGNWYTIQFNNSGDPFRAIGVLSTDSFSSANPDGNGWSFRPLDGAGVYNINTQAFASGPGTGVAPSKQNLIDGKYDFAVELTLQYRKVAVTNEFGDNVAALSGLKKTFADFFIARVGS